ACGKTIQHVERDVVVAFGADGGGAIALVRKIRLACGAIGAGTAIGIRPEAELLALDLDGILAPRFDQREEGLTRSTRCALLTSRGACPLDRRLGIALHRASAGALGRRRWRWQEEGA